VQTGQIKEMGVEVVPSMEELLKKADYVLLCTVDIGCICSKQKKY